jgi:WD40 repeat protein/serine/threonine protein kinase
VAASDSPQSGADRNLLFGILALQLDFITRDALIQAMHAWVLKKTKPLGQILIDQGALVGDRYTLLEALVQEHLKQHSDDPEKSLAALSSLGSVRDQLQSLKDPDVEATLSHLTREAAEQSTIDLPSPGLSTSAGGRFRILRPHARGGLGEVFVARDEELHRDVALKQIQERHADNPQSRSRFIMEAEITGGLEHPGIVPVYGLGTYADGRPFYAMRFIKGDSLKDAIERYHSVDGKRLDSGERALEFRKLLGRFLDVCNAIAYAHSRGVLHRDLKPGNIMLGQYGETLVVDWGLAKPVGRAEKVEGAESTLRPPSASGSAPTQAGAALGTPAYMSPEQAAGKLDELGPASDVYSLGASLYCLLTGKPPVEEPNLALAVAHVQAGEIRPPRVINPEVPRPLDAVCQKAMSLGPKDRYQSPRDLADDIEHWLADEPVSAYLEPAHERATRWCRRHRAVVTAAVAAVLVAGCVSTVAAIYLKASKERERMARREEATARTLAEHKMREAEAAKQRAERAEFAAKANEASAAWRLYVSQIHLAQHEWQNGNASGGRELLSRLENAGCRGWEYEYLRSTFGRNQHTLRGHSNHVASAAFTSDGKRIISGSWDKTIKVWDTTSGQVVLTLTGHTAVVRSVALSSDGKHIASASSDKTAKVWDIATGHEVLTLKGHNDQVRGVAFSPDGTRLATCSEDKTVKIWDAVTGTPLITLKGFGWGVHSIAFSPDGKHLASDGGDTTIRIWDTTTGNNIATLRGHRAGIGGIAYSLDGRRIVSGSYDKSVNLWDANTGRSLMTFAGHTNDVESVAFSHDGKTIASGSADCTIKVWDTTSSSEKLTLKGHSDWVTSVAFDSEDKRITSASYDGTIKIWNASMNQDSLILDAPDMEMGRVKFSPDGKAIIGVGGGGRRGRSVIVWDTTTGREVANIKTRGWGAAGAAFSEDGKRAACSMGRSVTIWDPMTGHEILALNNHHEYMAAVAFSPDGKRIACGCEEHAVEIWDCTTGQEIRTRQTKKDRPRFPHSIGGAPSFFGVVEGLAFSPDGAHLASPTADGITIWDPTSGSEVLTLKAPGVWCIAFRPDGTQIAASTPRELYMWDAKTGRLVWTIQSHSGFMKCIAFSPNGTRIVTGGQAVKVLDTTTGAEVLDLKCQGREVTTVAFSSDGQRIGCGMADGLVQIWDASQP